VPESLRALGNMFTVRSPRFPMGVIRFSHKLSK